MLRYSSRLLSSVGSTSTLAPLPIAYHIVKRPLPYTVGLQLQNDIIDARLEAKGRNPESSVARQDVMLLLEHLPTYTTGRRDSSPNPDTLHPEEKKVQNVGAEFHITKRGGQVTYHGPGQLVGYPILDLNNLNISTRCYVSYVQEALAKYVTETYGIPVHAPHPDGHVGVFASPTEKLASIGIHLRHRISSHGFSMNITPEPTKWFDLVLACGLADVQAISLFDMIKRTGGDVGGLSVQRTARDMIPFFAKRFGSDFVSLDSLSLCSGEQSDGAKMLDGLIKGAEEEAGRMIGDGGWRVEPDLRGRMDLPTL